MYLYESKTVLLPINIVTIAKNSRMVFIRLFDLLPVTLFAAPVAATTAAWIPAFLFLPYQIEDI